jgi:hypothetical protein
MLSSFGGEVMNKKPKHTAGSHVLCEIRVEFYLNVDGELM